MANFRMKFMLALTVIIHLSVPKLVKKHVQNSICPNYEVTPIYDITGWVNRLQLQICTIVEVGDLNCALFIEDRYRKHKENEAIRSYFLGICDVETLSKWRLCNAELSLARPDECSVDVLDFDKLTSSPRVHRRFCDMSLIARSQPRCKCAPTVSGSELFCVTGFPTCFLDPLPASLCEHYSACGFGSCRASTVLGRIHVIECGPNCIGEQPFCEYPAGAKTSEVPKMSSFWSEWQEESRYESRNSPARFRSIATCINMETSQGALDCLGPGTNCCPRSVINCICHTYIEDGVLKVYRVYEKKNVPLSKTSNMYLEINDNRQAQNKSGTNQLTIHIKKLEKIDVKPVSILGLESNRSADSPPIHTFADELRSRRVPRGVDRNEPFEISNLRRYVRDADPDDMEDDDEDNDDLGEEDIAIEEVDRVDDLVATTEEPEGDEISELQKNEVKKELSNETVLFENTDIEFNTGKDLAKLQGAPEVLTSILTRLHDGIELPMPGKQMSRFMSAIEENQHPHECVKKLIGSLYVKARRL